MPEIAFAEIAFAPDPAKAHRPQSQRPTQAKTMLDKAKTVLDNAKDRDEVDKYADEMSKSWVRLASAS